MLTDNQLYGGMNRRFDKRVRFLSRFGFRYKIIKSEYDPRSTYAVLTRVRQHREHAIPASLVLTATNRVFRDMVLRKYLERQ